MDVERASLVNGLALSLLVIHLFVSCNYEKYDNI